jgi:hypothetical protein
VRDGFGEYVSAHDLTREVLERDYLASDEVTQELSRTENVLGLLEGDWVDRHRDISTAGLGVREDD